MKIAHLIWSFTTGGIETMLIDIANEQAKTEEVSILCVNDNIDISLKEKLVTTVKFYNFGRKLGGKSFLPWIKLNLWLYKNKPDILHFHSGKIVTYVLYNVPKIRTVHNTQAFYSDLRLYDKICCISKRVKQYVAEGGFSNAVVNYNGIYTENIKTRKNPPHSIQTIVCVGRLHKDKGQEILIEALHILMQKYGNIPFHIDLIGDGPLRHCLESKINTYGIKYYVSLLGMRDRSYIYNHLCDYDLYIMPSISEGFGLTLAEAVCAKIPVLTSDLEGPLEVIDEGRLGNCFQVGNAQCLADKLYYMTTNKVDVESIEKAYDFVRQNFNVCKTAERYLQIYHNL